MRFGLLLAVNGGEWDVVRREAELVEAVGFDVAWVGDHLLYPRAAAPLESMTALGAIAALTSSVRLAIVTAATSFRHPGVFAKQVTTLQHVSGGRFTCLLGSGADEAEHRAFGLPFGSPGERFERLEEYAGVCRALWSANGEPVRHQGPRYPLDGAADRPPSPAATPLGFGGTGPRLLRLAAAVGDEWCFGLVPDHQEAVDRFSVERERAGRSVEVSALVPFAGPDAGRHPLAAHPRNLAVGPAAVRAQLRRYQAAGVGTLYLVPVGRGAAALAAEHLVELRDAAS